MRQNTLIATAATLLVFFTAVAEAQSTGPDYAREQKWADEVVPGLVVGDPVYLQTARNPHKFLGLFTPAADKQRAVIVVHGLGIHPDWGMVGTLRTELADRGLTTLSIQMPILAVEAQGDAYPPTFPEAADRIAAAVAWLKTRGYTRLAVVSHSMGSRMSAIYMTGKPDPAVKAWASLGLSYGDYAGLSLPVLDMYGDADLPLVLTHAGKRKQSLASTQSRQVVIAKSDHFYAGHEKEMVDAVATFLADTLK